MVNIILSILLFTCTVVSFGQSKLKRDSLEIWTTFSIGDLINENAHQIASRDWPFTTVSKAGDTFDNDLMDSVERHNSRIWNHLDSIGYKNAKHDYYKAFKAERSRIKKAIALSELNPEVLKLHKKLYSQKRMNSTVLNKLNDFEYEFIISSFSVSELEAPPTLELKYISDLRNNKVRIVK